MDTSVSSPAPTMPPASIFQRSVFVARSTSCDRCDGLSRQSVRGVAGQPLSTCPASVVDVVKEVAGPEVVDEVVVEEVLVGAEVEDVVVLVLDEVVDDEVVLHDDEKVVYELV